MRCTVLLLAVLVASLCICASATQVTYDGRAIIIDGERRVLISGSIHYPRSTPEMWPDLIKKSKEGGLNTIETYVFWNVHEPRPREYDFTGRRDLVRFLKTVHDAGLYAVLRIGPYVCAEWNYGAFPVWLHNIPGIQLRTDNEIYKNEMQIFTTKIVDMVKAEKLLAGQGGPIILTQIENEYGNVQGPYGDAGHRYIQWCAKMAESLNVGVPWIMCQQNDAPQPMINTCNGFYCDSFKPNNPNSPKMWTENWTGWFKGWGGRDPHRPAEDVAYAVARFYQTGGTFQNYYMYHGGTNFGRTAGGPYIATSYDYDAPLDEYGNLRQPKWGHLKQLHEILISMEKVLTSGTVSNTSFGFGADATIYTLDGASSCFLSNTNTTNDATVTFQGIQYFLPAWSVSILPDCKQVAYNTAKVTTQTALMEMKPNSAESIIPEQLDWQWRPEIIKGILKLANSTFTSTQLIEQKQAAADESDYLWYSTSVVIGKNDPSHSKEMVLSVNTTGHVLHAYVNGKLAGSQYAANGKYQFVFNQTVHLKSGRNYISLLSVTVGLQNYGAFFDMGPSGIVGGPVQIIGSGNVTKDISSSKWLYKVGLISEQKKLYEIDNLKKVKWHNESLPTKRAMTWYKASFPAPLGTDPVVVDLQGMGKGSAWINGQNIGRYWPTNLASQDGCPSVCNYRGVYKPENCPTGCGEPTQRYYHVPRSFLGDDENIIVLFEEIGGDPKDINFQTVSVGKVCSKIEEGSTLQLKCPSGKSISAIEFASFGNPEGQCGSFQKGGCNIASALSAVQKACVGNVSCSVSVTEEVLGSDSSCGNLHKSLAVQATC
ncbi:hypothetical protein AMTRI_Chr12g267700 [Amborella trichopoda]|uniref:Beta-galactosidase n=1 Tax=Amborella trichopoda TaxID=13333 RepID=W1PCA7_AMBTC|nr:beta-galactosidase 15 [Amborella trichopoda]ERN05588.1 hypothetical protein AMTR_s00007p00269020 [Amborella trichopoda]|eukprot:XP_006843913.1 beta-galactosidase 15 [Amborella trichopoda]